MWYAMYTLIRKELQAIFTNATSLRILIMPVILQVALFPFAATLEVKNSTLAIYNDDGGASSIELMQRLAAAKAFPHIINVHSQAEMEDLIDRQEALLAIRIPSDFSRKIDRHEAANIQAIVDGRRSNSAQIAYGYAQQVVTQFDRDNSKLALPAQLVIQNLYNPNLEYQWFILPSLVAIITTIGCLMVTALSLAREREEGTFDQLLVSPITPAYIMAGKALPGIIVAMMQGTIIATAAVFVYHVPFNGSVWLLYFSIFCYGMSLAGFGLFISALCNSQQQAFLGVFGFMTPAVILSGYMAPVENMPTVLRWISAMDPLSYIIIVIKGIFLKGYDLPQAWPNLWPLLIISAVTLSAAYLIFRNRSGQ